MGEPFEFTEYYGRKMTDDLVKEADEKLLNKLLDLRRGHAEFLAAKKRRKKS